MPLDTKKAEQLREQLGLTLDDAAKRAGFTAGRQRWFNVMQGAGNVELSTLEAIARALECDPCDLLTSTTRKKAKK